MGGIDEVGERSSSGGEKKGEGGEDRVTSGSR
jgi:hypothetical protein